MRLTRAVTVLLPVLLLLASCSDNDRRGLRDPPTEEPTPIPPAPTPLRIDYRVTGTIPNTQITYFSSSQGTTQTTTDLPWFLSYQTTDASTFVYLAATAPTDNLLEGTLTVQIFVDGVLFREARSSGFTPSVTISGEVTQ